jgi:uncharacterized SAM-binding protein YcdF (DUF218 family)
MTDIRHTIEALVSPFFLALLCVIIALYFSWQIVWARRLLLLGIMLFILFSTAFFPALLTKKLESIYPPIAYVDQSIKTIVVLSGGQADEASQPADIVLNSASIKRLLTAIRLWKAIPESTLLLSGGGYKRQIPEAELLKNLAIQCGVPLLNIKIENQSLNTADQARLLKQTLGKERFYLVTSAAHMPRSMALFQDQGLHPIAAPADLTYYWLDERWQKRYIPNAHNLVYTDIALHEYLGLLSDIFEN